jgi:hypothetical protein
LPLLAPEQAKRNIVADAAQASPITCFHWLFRIPDLSFDLSRTRGTQTQKQDFFFLMRTLALDCIYEGRSVDRESIRRKPAPAETA